MLFCISKERKEDIKMETDSLELLKECDAGVKMGISSLDEVIESVSDLELRDILEESRNRHYILKKRVEEYLKKYREEGKEPPTMAKAMSWAKTNWKLAVGESDHKVADLVTDGCNMGIKSLHRYLNQYPAAKKEIRGLAQNLVGIEEELGKRLRNYL